MTPAREKLPNICYRIQIFNPPLKYCRYYFKKEGRIILTGKKKSNEIYIGHRNDIHISSSEKEICGRIMQCDGHNIAYVNGQEIRLTYVPYFVRNQFSLTTSFVIGGETVTWSPRTIDSALSGEFNRPSIQSNKSIECKDSCDEVYSPLSIGAENTKNSLRKFYKSSVLDSTKIIKNAKEFFFLIEI
ncbi:hypothetical protein M9Y10_008108 [Tritrichomonas musculus]|uniref:FHA domain-containing protein n=1 Tax=Tritrichomonas musculus TaxID=1915356 RepID=A0ABR2IXM0_9EUKA